MWYRLGLEVDYVFGYLDDRDLYTCLFVNRQFNNCATQFLYRSIRFEGGLTSDYSSEDYKIKESKKQKSFWATISSRLNFARHIRHLDINPLNGRQAVIFPPFSERLSFLIHHTHLQTFQYIIINDDPSLDYATPILGSLIADLETSGNNPEILMATREPVLDQYRGELLLYINDKFRVTEIDILSEGTHDMLLEFLAEFRHLRHLALWNLGSVDGNENDMDRFLGHLPLRELTLHDSIQVGSFPHQLQALNVDATGTALTDNVWGAICELTNLSQIDIECDDIEERIDEEPYIFKSSNLQMLSGVIIGKTEEVLIRQIIQPIYASCQHLTTIELNISLPLSSNTLGLFLSKETLVSVLLSTAASPYTFQEFAGLPKILPTLKTLLLPWPAAINIAAAADEEGSAVDWRYERDSSQDIPERLKFDHCQHLAAKFPKLNTILFTIDVAEDACETTYPTWSESVQHDVPFNPAIVGDIDQPRRAQSFKMDTLIDSGSPCLNVCSEFKCSFESDNDTNEEGNPRMIMTFFLYLNQVRRHAGTQ